MPAKVSSITGTVGAGGNIVYKVIIDADGGRAIRSTKALTNTISKDVSLLEGQLQGVGAGTEVTIKHTANAAKEAASVLSGVSRTATRAMRNVNQATINTLQAIASQATSAATQITSTMGTQIGELTTLVNALPSVFNMMNTEVRTTLSQMATSLGEIIALQNQVAAGAGAGAGRRTRRTRRGAGVVGAGDGGGDLGRSDGTDRRGGRRRGIYDSLRALTTDEAMIMTAGKALISGVVITALFGSIYGAINAVREAIGGTVRFFTEAYKVFSEFEKRVVSIKALLATMFRFDEDPIKNFQAAGVVALDVYKELARRNKDTIADLEQMMLAYQSAIGGGIFKYVKSQEEAIDVIVTLTNAIAALTTGQDPVRQMTQEMRDFLAGNLRSVSALSKMLNDILPAGLKKQLVLWERSKGMAEGLRIALSGWNLAAKEFAMTFEGLQSTAESLWEIFAIDTFQKTFEQMKKDVFSILEDLLEVDTLAAKLVKHLSYQAGRHIFAGYEAFVKRLSELMSPVSILNSLINAFTGKEGRFREIGKFLAESLEIVVDALLAIIDDMTSGRILSVIVHYGKAFFLLIGGLIGEGIANALISSITHMHETVTERAAREFEEALALATHERVGGMANAILARGGGAGTASGKAPSRITELELAVAHRIGELNSSVTTLTTEIKRNKDLLAAGQSRGLTLSPTRRAEIASNIKAAESELTRVGAELRSFSTGSSPLQMELVAAQKNLRTVQRDAILKAYKLAELNTVPVEQYLDKLIRQANRVGAPIPKDLLESVGDAALDNSSILQYIKDPSAFHAKAKAGQLSAAAGEIPFLRDLWSKEGISADISKLAVTRPDTTRQDALRAVIKEAVESIRENIMDISTRMVSDQVQKILGGSFKNKLGEQEQFFIPGSGNIAQYAKEFESVREALDPFFQIAKAKEFLAITKETFDENVKGHQVLGRQAVDQLSDIAGMRLEIADNVVKAVEEEISGINKVLSVDEIVTKRLEESLRKVNDLFAENARLIEQIAQKVPQYPGLFGVAQYAAKEGALQQNENARRQREIDLNAQAQSLRVFLTDQEKQKQSNEIISSAIAEANATQRQFVDALGGYGGRADSDSIVAQIEKLEKIKLDESIIKDSEAIAKLNAEIQDLNITLFESVTSVMSMSSAIQEFLLRVLSKIGTKAWKPLEAVKETLKEMGDLLKGAIAQGIANMIQGLITGTSSFQEAIGSLLISVGNLMIMIGTLLVLGSTVLGLHGAPTGVALIAAGAGSIALGSAIGGRGPKATGGSSSAGTANETPKFSFDQSYILAQQGMIDATINLSHALSNLTTMAPGVVVKAGNQQNGGLLYQVAGEAGKGTNANSNVRLGRALAGAY